LWLIETLFRDPIQALAWIIAVAYAITVHEYAHARRALAAGDRTAQLQGRISLNPIKHYDPIGTTAMLLFGFGWAKPVPVNPSNFRHPRKDDIMVSFWGPLSNFISAIVFSAILNVLSRTIQVSIGLQDLLVSLILLNVILGIFNLIPLPPLDGSHILAGILPYESSRRYSYWAGRWGFIALIALIFFGGSLISPIIGFVTSLLIR
jgi:Zn-dependent protease